MNPLVTNLLQEIREWLKTWGGKLSVAAASVGAPLAEHGLTALGIAEYVPSGWPRGLFLVAIGAAIIIAPMKATKKDAKDGTLPDA